VNEIISKNIQASDQLEVLFEISLQRFGYTKTMHAQFVIQKLREDLHLFQNPSSALATINSYEMMQSSAEEHETISALSSHPSNSAPDLRPKIRLPAPLLARATLVTASGQKLVRASSASRAAQVLAQRFNLQ
jgi:hypothetical protein